MEMEYCEKMKDLIYNYIKLLDEEYAVISELLEYIDRLSNLKLNDIRRIYIEKLDQIRQVREKNYQVLRILDDIVHLYNHASAGLDSLIAIDDDDVSAIAEAKSTASGIATSILETSIDAHLTDQEKSVQRRKQLADALRKGEPVIISPDGQIVETSTSDSIVTYDRGILDLSDTMQVNAGFVEVSKGVFGCEDPTPNGIHVPEGKLAGDIGMTEKYINDLNVCRRE